MKWWGDFKDLASGERGFEPFEVKVADDISQDVNAITHPAPHHADEAFATAILSFFRPVVVYRTRETDEIARLRLGVLTESDATEARLPGSDEAASEYAVCYDVGGEFNPDSLVFDHHQRGYQEVRMDGVRFSSDGLIWREYGDLLLELIGCPDELIIDAQKEVDDVLFHGIDALDNGQTQDGVLMSVGTLFGYFNSTWDEERSGHESFLEMIAMAQNVLKRVITNVISVLKGQQIVERAIVEAGERKYIVLGKRITGWREAVIRSKNPVAQKILYGIYPDGSTGHWAIKTVPPALDRMMEQRKAFPESWRGLRGDDLAKITGVKTANFCHLAGFLAVADEKDDAIRLAELALR